MDNKLEIKRDIAWINTGKALCMICVYIAHCNFYYLDIQSPIHFIYKPFYLSLFFFISGFLLFNNLESFPFKKKLSSVANKLVWPAILFPACIWLPKMFAHGNMININAFMMDIFGGTATWFVSALIVAQLVCILLIFLFKNRLYLMLLITAGLMFLAFYLRTIDETPFPWYYKSGMIASFFLVLGGVARKYYDTLQSIISVWAMIISGAMFLAIMLYNYYNWGYGQAIMNARYESIPLGLFNNFLGIFFMIQLCHFIPEIKWLQYIGKNSIVFYFFGGGVPLVIGLLVRTYVPFEGYLMTILVTITCLAIVFPVNYVIKRFFPWMLDFSLITKRFKS